MVQLVVLVRRGHPGHLQHHARRRPCCSSQLAGLPRRRAGDLPAPRRKAPLRNPTPIHAIQQRRTRNIRKVNHVNRLPFRLVAAAAAAAAGGSGTDQLPRPRSPRRPTGNRPSRARPHEITVAATDTACELSGTEGRTGANTFVITNNGTKVTEFYVYGEGERVMGEVENISPGLQRKLIVQLSEPGTYQTACKPGMIGDGIRGDFKVTGDAVKIDDRGQVQGGLRQLQALREQPDRRADRGHPGLRRRGQEGRHRRGQGAVPDRPHLLRAHRAGRRVVPRRSGPPHRPARGRPGAGPEVDRLPPAREGPVGAPACSPTPTRSPTSWSPTSRNSTPA